MSIAHSKDIVYNTGVLIWRQLNAHKFNGIYIHAESDNKRIYLNLNESVSSSVSFVVTHIRDALIYMFDIERHIRKYYISTKESFVLDMYNALRHTSFIFKVNNYEIIIHNTDSISIDTSRILRSRKVCGMCVFISFTSDE